MLSNCNSTELCYTSQTIHKAVRVAVVLLTPDAPSEDAWSSGSDIELQLLEVMLLWDCLPQTCHTTPTAEVLRRTAAT